MSDDTVAPFPFPTAEGLDGLRVMMADRRLVNFEKFAHVRRSLAWKATRCDG